MLTLHAQEFLCLIKYIGNISKVMQDDFDAYYNNFLPAEKKAYDKREHGNTVITLPSAGRQQLG
jgi:hypothetical protein